VSWLVTTDNDQFSAKSLEDLKKKARSGELSPGDLVQPPGARDWLYAFELPEVGECFGQSSGSLDLEIRRSPLGKMFGIALLLGGIGLFAGAWHYYQIIPKSADLQLLGEKGMSQDEGLVTATSANIYASPEGTKKIGSFGKDKTIKILDKKYSFFLVESDQGQGWISVKDIAPAYLFAKDKIRKEYDERYNTHRHIAIHQESWKQLEHGVPITIFNFQLQNNSKLDLDHFEVKVKLMNEDKKPLQELVFNIKGLIEKGDTGKIGTLSPLEGSDQKIEYLTFTEFQKRRKLNPVLIKQWTDGLLVELNQIFPDASFKITHAKVKE